MARRGRRRAGMATLELALVMGPLMLIMTSLLMLCLWVFAIDEAQGAVDYAAVQGSGAATSGATVDLQGNAAGQASHEIDLPVSGGGSGADVLTAQAAQRVMSASLRWYSNPHITITRSVTDSNGGPLGVCSVRFDGHLLSMVRAFPGIDVSVAAIQPYHVAP